MDEALKESLWKQFGAAIDMFENAVRECPEEIWDNDSKFWYWSYHTLFFLDYYLTPEPENFSPPPPFTMSEFNAEGEMPERTYTKDELLKYSQFCRDKCRKLISGLTAESAANRWKNEYRNYSVFEILLYNLRHVQHHAGQLNLLIRQSNNEPPDWVSQTKIPMK
ncbi:MAG: DinB family protein [Ignavibacteria bacterium]|nr:DinB family protein [Ignavibacteria bacterium]